MKREGFELARCTVERLMKQIGMELMNMAPDADPMEMVKKIASQCDAMDEWTPMMQAEREALKAELEDLE